MYSSTSVPVCVEISTDASGGIADDDYGLTVSFDFDGDADVTDWSFSYEDDVYVASSSYSVYSIYDAGTRCIFVDIRGFQFYSFIDDPNEPDETVTVFFEGVSGWDDSETSLRNPIGAVSVRCLCLFFYFFFFWLLLLRCGLLSSWRDCEHCGIVRNPLSSAAEASRTSTIRVLVSFNTWACRR